MPGAGTDKTRRWLTTPAPVVVLVEPQMGENIGASARAMANFGLSELRLVKPVQGGPYERAKVMAAGGLAPPLEGRGALGQGLHWGLWAASRSSALCPAPGPTSPDAG